MGTNRRGPSTPTLPWWKGQFQDLWPPTASWSSIHSTWVGGESGTHRRGPCVLKRRSEFGKAFPQSPSEAHQGTLPVSPSPADHLVDVGVVCNDTDTLQRAHPGGSSEAPQVFTGKCPLRERQSISLPAPPPPPFGYPVCTDWTLFTPKLLFGVICSLNELKSEGGGTFPASKPQILYLEPKVWVLFFLYFSFRIVGPSTQLSFSFFFLLSFIC